MERGADGATVPAVGREAVAKPPPLPTAVLPGFMQQSCLKKAAGHFAGINLCAFHTSGSMDNPSRYKLASPSHIFKESSSWAQKNECTSMARDCGRQKIILLLISSCHNGQHLAPLIIGKPTVFNFSQVICPQTDSAVQEPAWKPVFAKRGYSAELAKTRQTHIVGLFLFFVGT